MASHLQIGIDTGGTFTDLIAWDGIAFRTAKVPSTPPDFQNGVLAAIASVLRPGETADLIHGSTVATNALLERRGSPLAFITTRGFADLLLIGRQNRPVLYDLEPRRTLPIVADEHIFTLDERISVDGSILSSLNAAELDGIITRIKSLGLQHVAVCLLFSFVNPSHEREVAERLVAAGLTVTVSSDLLREFREYERASVTVINAALRPNVEHYLNRLSQSLPTEVRSLQIMHSGGGTLTLTDAGRFAARLLLSGPAGGVLGASCVANLEGFAQTISYDMGGTSTDVAAIVDGKPPWTTGTTLDGLPVPLAMFDIHTIGAGGGSIASMDVGGALAVGPGSAGAFPGPACYGRGGTLPTVTDANLVLGRLVPDRFLGGRMPLHRDLAEAAIAPLAKQMNKSVIETALGMIRVAESSMAAAIRHVTAGRGHDPRHFTLLSFGGAGGLHAAALAESLDIPRILIPPHAGLLSAFGMVVAPPLVDVSKTIAHLTAPMTDLRRSLKYSETSDLSPSDPALACTAEPSLEAEFAQLAERAADQLSNGQTAAIERYADCRFHGQSYELTIPVTELSREAIGREFRSAYQTLYGQCPDNREVEIVTLRLRRIGFAPKLDLPTMVPHAMQPGTAKMVLSDGTSAEVEIFDRAGLAARGNVVGPALLSDADSTAFIPHGWSGRVTATGAVILDRDILL
jgi:N-methylhydantoinase A